MNNLAIYAVGFLAQGFFSARILIQWILSERAKRIESPTAYWVCSIIGSWLLFAYGCLRDDFSIILGQFISYYIYLWNLNSKGVWKGLNILLRALLALTPVAAAGLLAHNAPAFIATFLQNDSVPMWLLIFGSTGQVIFTLRFVYQWLYSRRHGESSLPIGFWIMSLTGSAMIVTYGIIRRDPVLILGQAVGFIAYFRNILIGLQTLKTPHDEK